MTLPGILSLVIATQFFLGVIIFLLRENYIKGLFGKQNQMQKQRLHELSILRTIQDKIGYSLNVDHVLDTVTTNLTKLFPKSAVCSMLLKDNKIIFSTYLEYTTSTKLIAQMRKLMTNSLELLLHEPLNLTVEEVKHGMPADNILGDEVASYFHIPIIVNGKTLGIISVCSNKKNAYKQDEIAIAFRIASQMCTELSKLQEVIQIEEGKLLAMIGSLADGIFMVDRNYNVTIMNQVGKKLLRLTSENPVLLEVIDRLSPAYDIRAKLQEAMEQNKPLQDNEVQIGNSTVQINITPVVATTRSYPIAVKQTTVIGASVIMHDITLEKQMAKLKEDFTSSMVHELRAPLSAIKAGSELMITEKEKLDNEQREKMLEIIHTQSDRMLHDINSLLDAAKLESGHFTIMPQAESILFVLAESQQLFAPQAEKKQIKITVDASPELPKGYFDPARIGQVVNNLISNAMKFTPDGGSIILHARKLYNEHLPKTKTNPGLIISVSDTGIGIPPEKQGKLFSKFTQLQNGGYGRQAQGTGLGLYVTKGIVEAHGGSISLESKPGHGTTISFTLPIAQPSTDVVKMETETPLIPLQPRTVN